MSHKQDSFSEEELTTLATVIINDLSISTKPPPNDFILLKDIHSIGYMDPDEEYTCDSLSSFIQSSNSFSTADNDITYSQYNTTTTPQTSINTTHTSPHISTMDSNLSDSLRTLSTSNYKYKLKTPYIKTFAGNKKNGIKHRLKR
eukprot:UN03250